LPPTSAYSIATTARATPPRTNPVRPVTPGAPSVLVLVEDFDELLAVCEEVLPVFAAVLEILLVLELVFFVPDVFDAVGAVVVLEGAAEPSLDPAPVVIVAGMYVKSVPVNVSVVIPGLFASSPPKDSVQTADAVPAREQSKYPVLSGHQHRSINGGVGSYNASTLLELFSYP